MSSHQFYIPVMGTGFTVDTPVHVAKYGVDSVVPLLDDVLLEEMRKYYCEKYDMVYQAIKNGIDARSHRITAYLNMLDDIISTQFEHLKSYVHDEGEALKNYIELLQKNNPLKEKYQEILKKIGLGEVQKETAFEELELRKGSIDVNIMTKIDADAYDRGKKAEEKYSIALASLRGFAESKIEAGVVFSAGLNRRLYSYLENFEDFFHDIKGKVKKKIILKVSDYRSALIQAKFLAKKGLWVSEFRIESGLNCGGHTFPTDGQLMGSILAEFKLKKKELSELLLQRVNEARRYKGKSIIENKPVFLVSFQGGIGTALEQKLLIDYYQVDRVGWGSPFLYVPEVTNVDETTLNRLLESKDVDDIYSSASSPLGISFQNFKSSISEQVRLKSIEEGNPGSPCPKQFLVSNVEFSKVPVCTASRFYQKNKIKEVKSMDISSKEKQQIIDKIVLKSCICNDLGSGVLVKYGISKKEKVNPAICPGPNLKYFHKIMSFKDMVKHIYGEKSVLDKEVVRPHVFLNELKLYIKHIQSESSLDKNKMKATLLKSLDYYQKIYEDVLKNYEEGKVSFLNRFKELSEELKTI